MERVYKIIIVLGLTLLYSIAYAQDAKGVYVIVKSETNKEIAKFNGNVIRDVYNSSSGNYRNPISIFRLYAHDKDHGQLELWHFYRINPKPHENTINPQDQHKTFLKDSSFLNTVDCLYWDDVKDLSWGDAHDYIGQSVFHRMQDGKKVKRTIYVIDMAEKQSDGKIKIYQVEDMSGISIRSDFMPEDEKQEWVKHTKTVREKIDKRRAERKARPFKK